MLIIDITRPLYWDDNRQENGGNKKACVDIFSWNKAEESSTAAVAVVNGEGLAPLQNNTASQYDFSTHHNHDGKTNICFAFSSISSICDLYTICDQKVTKISILTLNLMLSKAEGIRQELLHGFE